MAPPPFWNSQQLLFVTTTDLARNCTTGHVGGQYAPYFMEYGRCLAINGGSSVRDDVRSVSTMYVCGRMQAALDVKS